MIDNLMFLELETHPYAGSASDKDHKSRLALLHAEELVERLAGWAIDHQVGLVLEGLPKGAATPFDGKITPAQEMADDHRHESRGSDYDFTDSRLNRRIMAALLFANPGAFPIELAIEADKALLALDVGEVHALVRPRQVSGQEGRTLTKWILRGWALLHFEFLRGMKVDRTTALRSVAKAYGVATTTIISWGSDAPRRLLGVMPIVEMKRYARNVGARAHHLADTGIRTAEEKNRFERLQRRYGKDRLIEHGNNFKALSPKSS